MASEPTRPAVSGGEPEQMTPDESQRRPVSAWSNDTIASLLDTFADDEPKTVGEAMREAAKRLRVVPAPAPAAGPGEPPYEAEQVKQAHAHLLDIVLRRKYSGASLQKAIRALIAATHSATIQPR